MLTLQQLAQHINAQYQGKDLPFKGVSVDSRILQKGELFVALRAERDGHDFVSAAIKQGASCIMVDHPLDVKVPQIIVPDTLKGLGDLARAWREQFNIPVIALTGTAGKTTTKEMIAHILRERAPTLATEINLNNAIGVPLTLLKLTPEHQYAVIEIGTNSRGEIAYAAHIVRPTVALITNIHAQHIEKLGSVEGISQEKSDIFLPLDTQGIAIINLDEPFAESWKEKITTEQRVTFGINPNANVRAEHIHYDFQYCEYDLITPLGIQAVAIPMGGQHIVVNSLAAAAATLAVGATLNEIAQGLARLKAVEGRFKLYHLPTGAMLIDDAYNASFKSVENAVDALKTFNGKKILIMTNMGEMGKEAEHYHKKLGELMANAPLEAVFLYGDKELLANTLATCPKAQYFNSKAEIINAVLPLLQHQDTLVLIKGSHANHMHEIVTSIREQIKA
jgi:UDP-N-acetylmuramoyl-tripeptide--D-alanyl-D-alanine ligase